MNLSKNKKIFLGLIALMGIASLINTQAIVKIAKTVYPQSDSGVILDSSNQKAQVFGSARNCIELHPATSNHTTFIDPSGNFTTDFDGLSKHMFVIGLKIKNICNRDISIVKDSFTSSNSHSEAFKVANLEDFPNINNPSLSSGYTLNGPVTGIITDIYGITGQLINIPNSNLSGVMSTGDGEMKVTNIPAYGEKQFIIFSYANANSQGLEHNSRLSLKKIRWFLTQSYDDNLITASDMKVYSLTQSEVDRFTTSYVRFKGVSSDCAEGTVVGYNQDGSPIYCGGSDSEPCAPGTVIGYDGRGNPIYCDGLAVESSGSSYTDCAKGVVVGYNKDGTPIYCQ